MPPKPMSAALHHQPAIEVDVVMRQEPVPGPMRRWQAWRWVLADVLARSNPHETAALEPATQHDAHAVEPLGQNGASALCSHWLFTRFRVGLFADDAEGYFLNLSSPQPCFWVVWRADEARRVNGEPLAVPQIVTLSYHDAGRWLDAQEHVDQVPAQGAVVQWLRDFVDATYAPEPRRRKRPESFAPLVDRFGQPARVSTEKRGSHPTLPTTAVAAGHAASNTKP